jgi:ribosomal protein S18 acetylase RimI-like enzyme
VTVENGLYKITYIRAASKYAESFGKAMEGVARERKYLASTEGFPVEETKSFVKAIEKNNSAQFYALDGETVIGWCDILPKPFEGLRHVGTLGMGILSEYRRRGIGKKLLELTIEHAKTVNGMEKVELEVFKSNASAVRLYRKMGFKKEGERKRSRKLDGRYDDIVLMGKFI